MQLALPNYCVTILVSRMQEIPSRCPMKALSNGHSVFGPY